MFMLISVCVCVCIYRLVEVALALFGASVAMAVTDAFDAATVDMREGFR